MNKHFKSNERELVKVATFFKRQSRKLIDEGKLGEEHIKVEEAVDKFVEQMNKHADARAFVLDQRTQLEKLVKDNAACPSCSKRDMLKVVGTEMNEKGWKSNRYRCRRCNIEFTWNMPNNPWHMIQYIEEMIKLLEERSMDERVGQSERDQIASGLSSMRANLERLKPVIEAHDAEYNELQKRDLEMEKLIHEFKNSLLIEKIKMDTWENNQKGK
jgi:DNA-directed RNA polymerase subunit RPC12/RpoP